MRFKFVFVLSVILGLALGCKTEKMLSDEFDPGLLNGPVGITILPGEDLAFVTSSNYTLDYRNGALSVIDLSTNTIIESLTQEIPSFSGQVILDETNQRILIPNRLNNSLIVFDYEIPGEGGLPIKITVPTLPNSIDGLPNEIELEENPFGIIINEPSGHEPKIFVTNIKTGDASVLMRDDLTVVDADPDDDESNAIPLLTIASMPRNPRINDGVGANRLAKTSDQRLVYLTSSSSNYIFIIDSFDNRVEGVLDLGKYSAVAGMRGIAVAPDGKLYVAHKFLGGIIVLDVSGISDNGIDNEFIEETYLGFIPTGIGPEGVAFDAAATKLYVCNVDESSVSVIHLASMSNTATIYTERGPTEIAVHPTGGKAYVTNFLYDSVTVIDTASDSTTGVIK